MAIIAVQASHVTEKSLRQYQKNMSRVKNEVGYPALSIEEVIKISGISPEEISEVSYASLFMHNKSYLTELESWYCVGLEDQRLDFLKPVGYQKLIFEERKKERIKIVSDHLSISKNKINFVEHHLAHLAAAYYSCPTYEIGRKFLGLTCDGAGDGLAGSVSLCENNNINRIAEIDRHASLGKLYSRTTMLMGMRPWEHEFKLMGLAPYADPERVQIAADTYRNILGLSTNGLTFERVDELSTNYCYRELKNAFERVRFDTIAGAIQLFTEELLIEWVKSCIQITGIRDIVAGGGVFMNVKANMLIANLPEVRSFYVMPSAADESLSIGACLHSFYNNNSDKDHTESVFNNLYFGTEFTKQQEQKAVEKIAAGNPDLEVDEPNDIEEETATLLANGEIVARSCGKMEWGARSLGNRSILASGDNYGVVDELNRAIKQRDFWMPFAPAIIAESADRYLINPKKVNSQFMTHTFETNERGKSDLAAGTHPRDFTMRAQTVERSANPRFHKLLDSFKNKTGRGGLVNTSFNLHGEPIVRSPEDAIRVLQKSELKYLALGHFLLKKKTSKKTKY